MSFHIWFLIVGILLLCVALSSGLIERIPLTTSIVYLAIGFALGPSGLGMVGVNMIGESKFWERSTEIVVILSLFTAGLKLAVPFKDKRWRAAFLLASVGVAITVALIALTAMALGLPLGPAVLLGATLAPTDPVLASDVQVESHEDTDELRFALTGEAGLNDSTAFPFVLLGLFLIEGNPVSSWIGTWLLVDIAWKILAGIATGAVLGILVGRIANYIHARRGEAFGSEEFVALGLVSLSYGIALLIQAYGFLGVFAAALAFRWVERSDSKGKKSTRLANQVSSFNSQIERLAEVFILILVGSALSLHPPTAKGVLLAVVVLFLVRPVAVAVSLAGVRVPRSRRLLLSWFGIRGIGTLYYLSYAFQHGFIGTWTAEVASLCLTVILVSVILHGVSVTPLMHAYSRVRSRKR